MKRLVYTVVILAMLAVPASSVFADQPEVGDQVYYGDTILGQLIVPFGAGFAPFERVDAFLYRGSTVGGAWPNTFLPPAVGPTGSPTWWPWLGASEQRRWTYAETEGTVFERADAFGFWGAIVMLPRDEVWYPCSFPFKWKCNFEVAPLTWELHSPQFVAYDPAFGILSFWPWLLVDAAADPQDTVAPIQWLVRNYAPIPQGVLFESTVMGYAWKVSDIE